MSIEEEKKPIVEDLREKLNRMKLEKEKVQDTEGVKNPPPPDPAYNFLKDPLRGDNCAHSSNEKRVGNKERNSKSETKVESKETDNDQKHSAKADEKSPQKHQRSVLFVEDFKAPSQLRGPPKPYQKTLNNIMEKKIQPPKQQSVNNIKVEVSSESGERKCTFDDSKVIKVPITPKKNYTVKPKSGRWPHRGPQRYYDGRYNKPKTGFPVIPNRYVEESNQTRQKRHFKNRYNQQKDQAEAKEVSGNNVINTNKKCQVNEKEVDGNRKQSDITTSCNEQTKVDLETKAEVLSAKEN